MRKYMILMLFILVSVFAYAQEPKPKVEPYESKKYTGATKTTTVSVDQSLTKIVTVEIKEGPTVRERITWKNDLGGKWTRKEELFSASGRIKYEAVTYFDENEKIIRLEAKSENHKSNYVRTPDGRIVAEDGHDFEAGSEEVKKSEEKYQKYMKEIREKDMPAIEFSGTTDAQQQNNCRTKSVAFAGPSVLFGDYGKDKETFVGGHVFVMYNLTSHIGAGIDASMYFKKIGDQNITRSFFLARVEADRWDLCNDNHRINPDFHILAGFVTETLKYTVADKTYKSKGSGFAFGAGAGITVKIKDKIRAGLTADYLGVKFKNTDEVNSNIRVSAGVNISLWRKGLSQKTVLRY